MIFDIEDNFTNGSDNGNYTSENDFTWIKLHLAVPVRLTTSLAIVISALLAIKRIKRNTITLHFFFVANPMITDIGVGI